MNDLISRQAAIDAVDDVPYIKEHPNEGLLWKAWIEQLPSAQPEQKGEWIKLDAHAHLADHKCSTCGQECYVPTCMGDPMYDFCPNCGADMREGDSE